MTITFYAPHPDVAFLWPDVARAGWYFVKDRAGNLASIPFSLVKALRYRAAFVVRAYADRLTTEELVEGLQPNQIVIGEYAVAEVQVLRTLPTDPPASDLGAMVGRI